MVNCKTRSNTLSKNVIIASFLLALFVDVPSLNLIVIAAQPSLAGIFMSAMYTIEVVGLLAVAIFVQRRSIFNLRASHLGICLLCALWYAFTFTFVAPPSVTALLFGVFTLFAFLIPGILLIDMRAFLLALIIMPSVGILYIDKIFFSEILETGVISMGTCYALLVPVLGNLVYMRYFYRKESVWMKTVMLIFAAINIYYLVQMTMFGSRGPILCALLLILSFFIIQIDDKGKVSMHRGRLLVILVCMVFITLSFAAILHALNDFFATFDVSLNVVDKFLRLGESGDMSNGRVEISSMTWEGIINSPLWGNGTAQFLNNTGEVYPHNFILQFLYDGGIILTSAVLIPIIRTLIHKMRIVSEDEYICLLFLFFASVPGALLSGDLWVQGTLWLFFGVVLSRNTFSNSCK